MDEKKKAITRRLVKLELEAEKAVADADAETLFSLETEMQILKVYLGAIDCSMKDPDYLERKNIKLEINQAVIDSLADLSALSDNIRTEVICLLRGQCGV